MLQERGGTEKENKDWIRGSGENSNDKKKEVETNINDGPH